MLGVRVGTFLKVWVTVALAFLKVCATLACKVWVALALGGLLLVAAATTARANMAARLPESRPGDAPREPSGELKAMHIVRESLVIDMRPLKDRRPAVVEATYTVRNDSDTRDLELVFVAAAMQPGPAGAAWFWKGRDWVPDPQRRQNEGGVWLDGQPIAALTDANAGGLPEAWAPPARTPGLEPGQGGLPYKVLSEGTLTFRVTLAPGEHIIRVRYEARPGAYADAGSHAVYWQLGYVLAPAREWASFGGLDAKVLLPVGWRAASSPEMRREGDALVAKWEEIPADALAITAQTNERTNDDTEAFWNDLIIQGVLFTALAVLAGWKLGGLLGRCGRSSAWGLFVSPLVAVLLVTLSYFVAG
ncbi:MAG: hypothetical protein QOJ76_3275, partial [Acidobacteriota bacterium]|nr:hypothetical protein [Acidobacteriota bacterium]